MKEMTDEEVIQTLEHCIRIDCYDNEKCLLADAKSCVSTLLKNALKLINHQKAKIERLERIISIKQQNKRTIKSEARKEFAERCKERSYHPILTPAGFEAVPTNYIDNLLKEMEKEENE